MERVNSRADLEAIRGTPDFEIAMRGIYGSTISWTLVDGAWVAATDLSVLNRLNFTKAKFRDEVARFDFVDPVPPPVPVDPEPAPIPDDQILKDAMLSEFIERMAVSKTGDAAVKDAALRAKAAKATKL